MLISILVPVYNESAVILKTLEKVKEQQLENIEFEVIVIDDGSKDNTVELLKQHTELYSHLIELPQNQGKGKAIMTGIAAAKGEYILCQDADLEYDPRDYPQLMFPVTNYEADVVMGSRLTAPQYTRVHYFWHKQGNRLITTIFNVLNNTTFTDIYSGYFLFRKSLVDPDLLRAYSWEQQAEILSMTVQNGTVFYEVPISYHGRTYSDGKKIKAYHALAIIFMIIKCRIFPGWRK